VVWRIAYRVRRAIPHSTRPLLEIPAPVLITDTPTLTSFCDELRSAPYIAVDTEFLREKTYHAVLCLVQLGHGERFAAVDALAPGIDLAPLLALMSDPNIVKVFHSAGQDVEIFLKLSGSVPTPLFDTQIAATVCAFGEQPGYATLVKELLGVALDKASQATDWSIRPLTDRQLDYALGDVIHLCPIYETLLQRLAETGRDAWVKEEMDALLDESHYVTDPQEAWRRIKIRRPSRESLVVLRELAAWRERTAMERDLPRNWVIRDDALGEIAQHLPRDRKQLARTRGLKDPIARGKDGQTLLDLVQQALESPKDEWPTLPERRERLSGHEAMVALLQALLKLRCEAEGVAMKLVATRSELDLLATAEEPDVRAVHGWRREIFGDAALALRHGKLALTGDGKGVTAVSLAER
jgi:ribonuclease D